MVIEAAFVLFIFVLLGAGAYYAALRWVDLRHNRDMLADEYKRATEHIEELESRVMLLEAERDTQMAQMESKGMRPVDGFGVFDMRS
jgi:hypothetical protein